MVGNFTTASDAPGPLHAAIAWCYAQAVNQHVDTWSKAVQDALQGTPLAGAWQAASTDTLTPDQATLAWHLAQARKLCKAPAMVPAAEGHARVGLNGEMLDHDDAFAAHMRTAVPDWGGRTLPFKIEWTDSLAYTGMTFARLFVRVSPLDDGYALTVREDRRITLLSRREQEVARRIADGKTFKQIAEELGLAVSTVSTHLYRVYDKLAISKRSDLVRWMREHAPGAGKPPPR